MATCRSAAPAAAFEGFPGGFQPGSEGADEQVESVEDVLVPVFGAGEKVEHVGGEPLLVADVPLVEFVAEGHDLRVTPTSLVEIVRAVWLGLSVDHRLMFSAATPVGCLFFLVLGACLR
jgi:hypothetical protein